MLRNLNLQLISLRQTSKMWNFDSINDDKCSKILITEKRGNIDSPTSSLNTKRLDELSERTIYFQLGQIAKKV
jgi:hypothetical protein